MKIIEQSHDVLFHTGIEMLEIAGRPAINPKKKLGVQSLWIRCVISFPEKLPLKAARNIIVHTTLLTNLLRCW